MTYRSLTRCAAAFAAALVLGGFAIPSLAEAKAPGGKHCYGGVCHWVMTLSETASQIGKVRHLKASHYDSCKSDRHNPCGLTSSGEEFRPWEANNAASAIHPDGTVLLVRNPSGGKAAVVRVNNYGPFRGNRKIDVSKATAQKLGFASRGVADLEVQVLYAPTKSETKYKAYRRYASVAGYIGKTSSIGAAADQYWSKKPTKSRTAGATQSKNVPSAASGRTAR